MKPYFLTVSDKIQTRERFKTALFIRTKHNLQIFGVIPLSCCKTTLKQPSNGDKNDGKLDGKLFFFFFFFWGGGGN